eukprot:2553375-Rhodomonas_salina.1
MLEGGRKGPAGCSGGALGEGTRRRLDAAYARSVPHTTAHARRELGVVTWRSPYASSDTQKSGLQRRLRHRHSGDARTLHREVGVQPFLCLLCLAGARCRRPWSLDVATPGSWREKVSESFPASTEEGFQPLKVIARPGKEQGQMAAQRVFEKRGGPEDGMQSAS